MEAEHVQRTSQARPRSIFHKFLKFLKRLGFQKASKMEPKSVQNHEKSIQHRSKIYHWRLSAPKVHPKHVPDRFFAFFFNFWKPQGLPKWSQHRSKSLKIILKTMLKKEMCSNTYFSTIFIDFDLPNRGQIELFCELLRKCRFSENRCFSKVNSMILRL